MTSLPPAVARYTESVGVKDAEELRLYPDKPILVRSQRLGMVSGRVISEKEFLQVVYEICDHSLHTHYDTINEGYISYKGLRVGICGRAVTAVGKGIMGVRDFSGLCFRIPSVRRGCADAAVADFLAHRRGMLFYAPPGQGKTTVLREMIRTLSSSPHFCQVAAVDTRGELAYSLDGSCRTLDVLSYYPKAKGMEIALRCFAPQVIVCDEIGAAEAHALLYCASCGVPILASAHAATLVQLLSSAPIKALHKAGIFDSYVAIRRRNAGVHFTFTERQSLAGAEVD